MGDVDPTLAAITDTYTDWLATHGADSSRGVGWHDPLMQALRFDVLALVMEGAEPVTVADFGCGTGALFDRPRRAPEPPPLGGYTGYDLVPAMVESARERHSDPRARFEVGSAVAEEHDYVFASGAFTVRPGIDDDTWEAHLHEVITGLWDSRAPRDRVQPHDPHAQAGRAARLHRRPRGLGGLVLAEPPRRARGAAHGPAARRLHRARQTRAVRRVTWLETASETFVARYDERDADDAERVLAQLEYARERLQRKLDVAAGRPRRRPPPHQRAARRRPAVAAVQRARTAPAAAATSSARSPRRRSTCWRRGCWPSARRTSRGRSSC
jgi:SAM-dependent methyltransferase